MKKILVIMICGIILTVLCACETADQGNNVATETSFGTITLDSDGPIFSRYYTIEEFDSLKVGKSTVHDVEALHPGEGYFAIQGAEYIEIIYPLQESGCIYIIVDSNDIVTKIGINENADYPLRVEPGQGG